MTEEDCCSKCGYYGHHCGCPKPYTTIGEAKKAISEAPQNLVIANERIDKLEKQIKELDELIDKYGW